MMAEQAKVPAIRFAGFTDPWEQRKLEDIANRVTRKNEGESDLPLTISSQYGLVDQRTFFNNQVASKDMSGYYLLRKGEFAYNKSTSGDSPWGAVKRLVRYEKGCVSTLYICFGLDGADPDFLVTYYETDRWYKAVQMIAAEGARNHGLLNIAPNDFFDTALILPPSREEQELIGLFFARLDNLITLHQRKYDKLVVFKKSMLEKMFPKDGESVPEIRFAGFTDPWEQRKFGELYRPVSEKNDVSFGRDKAISVANMYFNPAVYVTEDSYLATYNVMRLGDIAFEGNRSKRFAHGRFVENTIGDGIVSHVFKVFRHVGDNYDLSYWKHAINNEKLMKDVLTRSTKASTMMHELVTADFLEELTLVPSLNEQRAIGAAIDSIDNLITLHQRKLELLQNIKKSLLDKMFV
ncbi:restriction endonuclease subunit S [Bifidobacterium breve]|nr:restriction endonuclease subunit S [Bifidobacterium breve]MCZ4475002.1 restriction endonuclease subunit S [Bifidobacterium breve]MCZ4478315.1 restriction endonuclease subunit S [Bifidobacterium breve]MCZ4485530.1 restriction endonuclease subunit S [Bifidobacterium breve]